MASNGKKKTTMAKLNRERRLQEKRLDKQARKERRKEAAANPGLETDADGWPLSMDGSDPDGVPGAPGETEAQGAEPADAVLNPDEAVDPDQAVDADVEPVAPARPL